jgi:dTDP-4-amino-4,6-dideoxygalactose transaminase
VTAARRNPVRPKDKFLLFGAPKFEEAEIAEVVECMRSGWVSTGPRVARFEKAFNEYCGGGHTVAVNSCTAALHLSLLSIGLKSGDEVITTPMTFCATVSTIIHAGGVPVLADVDPATMNIDPAQVARKITPRTKAVLPVHFAGRPCDMDALLAVARAHDLRVIEDCAHAIETEYKGRKAGAFGDFGCFSFYVTKNVVTGEGGMILTRHEAEAARLKRLALQGMSKDAWNRFGDTGFKHYSVLDLGFKYNMMDLQASIGLHQLARVEQNWQRRRDIWRQYDQAFAGLPVTLPPPPETDTRHAYHLYTILVDDQRCGISRDEFLEGMTAHHIGVGVHYMSIPEHPYYQQTFNIRPEDYPVAMRIGRQTVSLPLSPSLSEGDVADVIAAVTQLLTG